MIDYDKLKLAHELMSKLTDKYYLSMFVRNGVEYTLCPDNEIEYDMDFDSLDLLIDKLTELTQSKPKYEIGEAVWFVNSIGKIDNECIDDIGLGCEEPYFINEERWFNENDIYLTRDALIEAQIEYWHSLIEDCQHDRKFTGCQEAIRKHHELEDDDNESAVNYEFPYHIINKYQKSCSHEYTLLSGFKCIKCGYSSISNCTYTRPVQECQHQDDGKTYLTDPPQVKCVKCVKCGEFYR